MTEAESVTTFIMENRLPWPDDGNSSGVNGPFDTGVIYDAGQQRECFIRRISTLGATLRGEVGKAPGDDVSIELATGQRPAGTIDWVGGGEAGVVFKQPIDMLALINRKLISQPTERRAMPREVASSRRMSAIQGPSSGSGRVMASRKACPCRAASSGRPMRA